MLNPISRALEVCTMRIPPQILSRVFVDRHQSYRRTPVSMTQLIRERVIEPRVLVDCDIVGGTEVPISLAGLMYELSDTGERIYQIPKSMTQNRIITSVLDVTVDQQINASFNMLGNATPSGVQLANQALLNSHAAMPYVGTASAIIIAENTVAITIPSTVANLKMRCVVSNDTELSNLNIRTIKQFSEACVLAVKAYIYNQYIVELDMGELSGGQSLGIFRNIIEGWADADELYEEYIRETFTKVLFMNDAPAMQELWRLAIGGYR